MQTSAQKSILLGQQIESDSLMYGKSFFPWSYGKMGRKLNLWPFLDPQLWPEESYELGSVPLSFRPSIRKNSACVVVDDTAGFFEKNFLAPKIGQR